MVTGVPMGAHSYSRFASSSVRLTCKTLDLTSRAAKWIEGFGQRETPFAFFDIQYRIGRKLSRLVRARLQRGLDSLRSNAEETC